MEILLRQDLSMEQELTQKAPSSSSGAAPSYELPVKSRKELLHILLTIAENMLGCGGEIYRVENTISRMGKAYGTSRMNVFVITSSIIITMIFPDEQEITGSRRLSGSSTNLTRLEAYNEISRECCHSPMPIDELHRRVNDVTEQTKPLRREFYLGTAIGAFAFAVFFGGTFLDGFVAGAFGLLVAFLQEKLPPISSGRFIYHVLVSFLTGLSIGLFCRLVPGLHEDKIIIGDIMPLIPGIAITSAIRDVLAGETIAGLLRVVEALLWACALAVGFILSMLIVSTLGA